MLAFNVRVHGVKNYPSREGLLICANHQSYLDPMLLGVVCPRPINYLARKTLFRIKPMSWFLGWNDAIPIDRESSGIAGMKEMLRRLKRDESVLMFPEGTRTADGQLQPLMLGFCQIARRTKAPLVPVGFDGAFDAMPRTNKVPVPKRIHVVIGKPIYFKDYESLSDEQLGDLLFSRIKICVEDARQRCQRKAWF